MPRRAMKRTAGKAGKSQPKSKRAKTQAPSPKVQASDDVEDGSGSDGSSLDTTEEAREAIKELQSLIESTGKKKKEKEKGESSKAFEKRVKEDEKRLLGMLEDFEKEMKSEEEKFEAEFAELVAAALSPTGLKPSPTTEPLPLDPTPDDHPLYILSKTLLDNLQALVEEYEALQEHIVKVRAPENPASAMEKDYEEARRIISVGKEASAAEIAKLLGFEKKEKKEKKKKKRHRQKLSNKKSVGDDEHKNDDDGMEAFDNDPHLQATLKMGREEIVGKAGDDRKKVYGWGKVASGAKKAMKAIIKALPDE